MSFTLELDYGPIATATPCGRLKGGERKDALRDGHIRFTPAGFLHWASCSTICSRWRDGCNRDANASKRFVTRQQPQRIQPFTERWRMIIEGSVQGVGFGPVAIGVP